MKIIRFHAENFKRLTAVEITPDGNVITITGKNGAGKSSVLDAIWAAVGGKDCIPARPLRDGAEAGFVELDLGEYLVVRKFTDTGTTSLTVKSADGAKYSSPQKLLDGLMGAFTFNPVEFLDAKDKRALLLKTIELKPDWHEWQETIGEYPTDIGDALAFIESTRKEKYEQRRIANVERDRLKKALETAAAGHEPINEKLADLNALIAERDAAQDNNNRIMLVEVTHVKLIAAIAQLKEDLLRCEKDLVVAETFLSEHKVIDVSGLTERISTVEQSNRRIIEAQARDREIARLGAAVAQVESATIRADSLVSFIDEFKRELLEDAEMPVPGLGFDLDGNVTLNGLPFEQASASGKLRCAIAIAMKANPKLRVMRIENGEKFDSDSMKIIAEMAAENDTQIWMEVMSENGEVGIYIEDGSVKAA